MASNASQIVSGFLVGRVLPAIATNGIARIVASRLFASAAISKLLSKCGVAASAATTGVGIAITATPGFGTMDRKQDGSHRL